MRSNPHFNQHVTLRPISVFFEGGVNSARKLFLMSLVHVSAAVVSGLGFSELECLFLLLYYKMKGNCGAASAGND